MAEPAIKLADVAPRDPAIKNATVAEVAALLAA